MLTVGYYKDIFIGICGGVASYLFKYTRTTPKETFSITSLFVHIVLGAFVSYMIGTVIEPKTYGRELIIGFSGFFAFAILIFAESKFPEWLFNFIDILHKATIKKDRKD